MSLLRDRNRKAVDKPEPVENGFHFRGWVRVRVKG